MALPQRRGEALGKTPLLPPCSPAARTPRSSSRGRGGGPLSGGAGPAAARHVAALAGGGGGRVTRLGGGAGREAALWRCRPETRPAGRVGGWSEAAGEGERQLSCPHCRRLRVRPGAGPARDQADGTMVTKEPGEKVPRYGQRQDAAGLPRERADAVLGVLGKSPCPLRVVTLPQPHPGPDSSPQVLRSERRSTRRSRTSTPS